MFDPRLLPEDLSSYGEAKMQALTDFYGSTQRASFEREINTSVPDIDGDNSNAEWKFFIKFQGCIAIV